MNSQQLIEKIDLLPTSLQEQVEDFVEFLLNRHFQGKQETSYEPTLTEAQKAELNRRFMEYLTNPGSVDSLDNIKNRLMKKYGLQHSS